MAIVEDSVIIETKNLPTGFRTETMDGIIYVGIGGTVINDGTENT